MKVELSRKITTAKLRMIPFLKTLDASFFMRVAFFSGILWFFTQRTKTLNDERVICE